MLPRFLTLASGHRLAFDAYGDPQGTPTFYFHGWPSSRKQGELMDSIGKELGLCVVAMDRPGIGASDYQPGRRLSDWPGVMQQLADHLGWERFHLFGVSGGGPYVYATAHHLPGRVLTASVICGAPPLRLMGTKDLFWPYRYTMAVRNVMPSLLSPAFRMAAEVSKLKQTQPPLSWMLKFLGPEDRRALGDPDVYRIIVESFRECLRSGVDAVQADGDIYSHDWGFDLRQITLPIHIWHGQHDRNIPWTYAQKIADLLPNAITHWTPLDGHYSLPILRVREIAYTALGKVF